MAEPEGACVGLLPIVNVCGLVLVVPEVGKVEHLSNGTTALKVKGEGPTKRHKRGKRRPKPCRISPPLFPHTKS